MILTKYAVIGYPHMWIQGYIDAWIHGYKDTRIQGYRDTWIHGYMDTGIHVYAEMYGAPEQSGASLVCNSYIKIIHFNFLFKIIPFTYFLN